MILILLLVQNHQLNQLTPVKTSTIETQSTHRISPRASQHRSLSTSHVARRWRQRAERWLAARRDESRAHLSRMKTCCVFCTARGRGNAVIQYDNISSIVRRRRRCRRAYRINNEGVLWRATRIIMVLSICESNWQFSDCLQLSIELLMDAI